MKWAHPPQLPTISRLRFLAAHFVLISFELGFVIVAKLQALHRMQRLAVVNSLSERAWSLVMRLSFAAVIPVCWLAPSVTSSRQYTCAATKTFTFF